MVSRRFILKTGASALAAPWRVLAEPETPEFLPYLQDVRPHRATICWATFERGSGAVVCSADGAVGVTAASRASELAPSRTGLDRPLFVHEAVVGGLAEGTEYGYSILVEGVERRAVRQTRFRTQSGGALRFIVFGDSGSGDEAQLQLIPRMARENPDFLLHTGDLAYPLGTVEGYRSRYFAPYRELMERAPFYPSLGNHDYVDDSPAAYLALMRVPGDSVPASGRGRYYSFDWGDAHFVALDTNEPLWRAIEGQDPMLEWLDGDLSRSDRAWKIAFFHHTPYATGMHETSATAALVRQHVAPILERRGVQVVFCGHEHSYQRSHPIRGGVADAARGLLYITTGGGGGGLYPAPGGPLVAVGISAYHFVCAELDGERLALRAIGAGGEQLDAITVRAA